MNTLADRLPDTRLQQALLEQATPALVRKARRYAEQRAKLVRHAGRSVPRHYARELVHDAYVETWLGAAPWDPSRCSLLTHLCGVIRVRTWAEARHGRTFQRTSMEAISSEADIAEIERGLASCGDISPIMFSALVKRVTGELRRIAACDRECLAILSCWERGLYEPDEVIEVSGLDPNVYKHARQRLVYFTSDLPADFRDAVQTCLRRAS